MTTDKAIIALRIRVKSLEETIENLMTTLNTNTIQKSDLDRIRAEVIQLKDALARGDFGSIDSTDQGLSALIDEQVALSSRTTALLDSVNDEVTSISVDVASNLALIKLLQSQVATLIIRITS